MIINVAPQASIATTPSPSSPEEGTTLGAAGKEKFSNYLPFGRWVYDKSLKFLIKKDDEVK